MKRIYLDHASTTPIKEEVLNAMLPYFTEAFGNANSLHSAGREAVRAVDYARDTIANVIGAKPNEIYFTSGGTEADNWALKGTLTAYKDKGKHFIVSPLEHPAIMSSVKELTANGYEVSYLKVDKKGIVDTEYLKTQIRSDTVLICCMLANNEIGTIQPVKEIVDIAKERGVLVFTDAVQAMGSLDVNVKTLGVDMLAFSAHKFYGPKGVGCLYIKNGVKNDGIITGGHQERGRRGGTTNVAGVVGMAKALTIAVRDREENNANIKKLRDSFTEAVLNGLDNAYLNGDSEKRLVANADISFEGVSGEALLFNLDLNGICASNGSACSAGTIEPSHVLLAIGLDSKQAKSSVRFTFGVDNTEEEALYSAKTVIECVDRLKKQGRFNG